ncbi:Cytoplasmic dynein 2 heavy chain 1 [Eumeta japonica]|uniref:Cytoplasmic dynein 2 heavy chain 1 n=1 Tax=Eumeta variegata TaxID=151549 RepID=A0A4C1VX84_EUMVA|nr:Cytoplasmic dynein 2 heavy chain 1 [Eumeta japonica]
MTITFPNLQDDNIYLNKIKENLSELESNLKILAHGQNKENFDVIFTIEDEIEYWKSLAQKRDINKKEREAANTFKELFEEINEELQSIQSAQISDVQELTENVSGLLDDIWRYSVSSYPQDRMKHVFEIIGYALVTYLQKTLSSLEIWNINNDARDNHILMILSDCLGVMHMWTNACKSLTTTYWPNLALHSWNGEPYISNACLQFQDRLNEVYQIRSTFNQLNKLLTNIEKIELKINEIFEPFKNVNVWVNSPNLKQVWDNAVVMFSHNLKPIEHKIAIKLKSRLCNTSTKQMLYEFMRYKSLINRPSVKQALQKELEAFLVQLESFLDVIKNHIESDDAHDVKINRPTEMSYIVQKIQWAKQMEYKLDGRDDTIRIRTNERLERSENSTVDHRNAMNTDMLPVKDIHECAEKYLCEFDSNQRLLNLSTQVLDEIKNVCVQLHEDWSRDLQAQVKDGSLKLSMTKPVVEFSPNNQMMVVHFNPRLMAIELEARGMTAMGFPPPATVKEAIDSLSRFLTHARCLQQIASFHNTLGERMIPSTRPMMLQAALDLSSLVQEQKAVYWSNIEQVTNYSDKLKRAVAKLESQNSYLTNEHIAIRKIVETLLNTDLLSKQGEWKKKMKDVRGIIEKVDAEGYKNTELWKAHWDWQLYKVLECQYIKTLLSLHKHFPHVKVDLVLRGRSVCLQPPIEEIRAQHYQQLRRLISVPAQFVALQTKVGDTTGSIFHNIIEKHGWLGNKSVRKLEATLNSVEELCKEWTRRSALACVDLETLCREKLREPQDWEINFKACKAYGQAVAKMSFEDEKIEWISIGTLTLRREFEVQVRNFWSCLISSLQMSCRDDAVLTDSFVANATLTLESKTLPKNARELSEISARQQALQEKMPEMEKIIQNLKRKSHMLRTWGGDQTVDSTIKEWQKIQELISSQQQQFEHQAEIVKSSLSGEWSNLNVSIETFVSRWTQGRLRFDENRASNFTDMYGRCRQVLEGCQQWEKLVQDKEELIKECTKFSEIRFIRTWEQCEAMVKEDLQLWSIFEEYSSDYKSLVEQEWVVCQKKLHLIDEFIVKWNTRLEPYTVVTLFIQQELDKYSDLTVVLKYLRGTDFTERHWREVFNVLEMEYKKPDTLLLNDFLNSSSKIKKQIKILQKICASAATESAIRGALNDLELWFAGARLTITYYKDKTSQSTPIVKDFKDITSKIEEQQWIVGSLRGAESDGASGVDGCTMWEARLRTAYEIVRATHHAQRRHTFAIALAIIENSGQIHKKKLAIMSNHAHYRVPKP